MATDVGTESAKAPISAPPAIEHSSRPRFDRSSVTVDAMVTVHDVTEEDWWEYAPDNQVCEYLDGVVYMPSPATNEHQDQVGFWHLLLALYNLRKKIGVVRLGPGVLRLAPGRNPEPDVFVTPSGEGPHPAPALLVVEVLSRSTRKHDMEEKADHYREASIPELLFVDLERKRLIVTHLREDIYETSVLQSGHWHSSALPGFWIDVSWLWQVPLPDADLRAAEILAGPPA